jgi:ribonuclease HI
MIELLSMEIIEENKDDFGICVSRLKGNEYTKVTFNPFNKTMHINKSNELGKFLAKNEYQFRKLLHNIRVYTYKIGFTLQFSIIDKKDIAEFNNKNNIIVTEHGKAYVIQNSEENILQVYTDGSFDETSMTGAYGYAFERNGVIINEVYEESDSKSSSHLELLAVINALEYIKDKRIRIFTDSQYVRKGITEWIYHWRENNFTTANGTKAKNIEDWIKLDHLIRNRYIQWVWIKSHRDNEIHNRVDENVRKKAKAKLSYISYF